MEFSRSALLHEDDLRKDPPGFVSARRYSRAFQFIRFGIIKRKGDFHGFGACGGIITKTRHGLNHKILYAVGDEVRGVFDSIVWA